MNKLGIFFAEGYEEIEALTVVDVCRRAGLDITMVSVTGQQVVTGSHGISVTMDKKLEEVCFEELDMIVLPGGMPGTLGLEATETLMSKVDDFYEKEKYVAAICAAPSILGHRGLLKGKKACCYPGFESHLEGAEVVMDEVAVAGKVITSRGMGCAIAFALAIVEAFLGKEKATEIGKSIIYK